MRTPKRPACAAALLSLLVAAGACGDDPTDAAPDSPPPSASTTPASTGEPTSSAPTTSGASPTETADPASGPPLDLAHVSARLPEGWKTQPSSYRGQQSGQHPETLSYILLTDDEYIGPDPVDLDRLARIARKSAEGKVLPHTTLAGSPAYHLAGKDSSITTFEKFGTVHEDRSITVVFQFRVDFPPGKQAEVIESVLASLTYK